MQPPSVIEWALIQQAEDGYIDFVGLRSRYKGDRVNLRVIDHLERSRTMQEAVADAADRYNEECDRLARDLTRELIHAFNM